MATLPYIASPGNIERALNAVKVAATPPTVSQDFVKTVLKIAGGPGDQMTSYLKKIGFKNADGAPSDLYKRFRNSATEGSAAAEALKIGYQALYVRNEYMHELSDEKLRGLIVEETGWSKDAATVSLTVSCIKQLKKFAKWDSDAAAEPKPPARVDTGLPPPPREEPHHAPARQLRMQLGYTINLNLPATSDVAVFNAIFKSLKEHLLKTSDE